MNIQKIISQLTLEEKASLCAGADAWHTQKIDKLDIPSISVADGPHGLRLEREDGSQPILKDSYPATCFPTASALASTWNRKLLEEIGAALGEECLSVGVDVILGPGANIKRSPLCGRNFEYFSEDPYLSGEMAAAMIQGTQGEGIGSSLKHFVANNQEYRRMLFDAVIDERALREIYLAGFEIAVKKAQPWTIMAAYNKVNGEYCTEQTRLLQEILRNEWGFQGLVMSDWGAVDNRTHGLEAGMDLEMPGVPNGNDVTIVRNVLEGRLSEQVLDATIGRLLRLIGHVQKKPKESFSNDLDAHHALAKEAAGEGAVLLKNELNILPLKKDLKIAVIGAFAERPRYQGSGSSLIHPTRLDTLVTEMTTIAGEDQIMYAPGYSLMGSEDDAYLLADAVELAKKVDRVVLCVGLTDMDEVEGLDREHMLLPDSHNTLIETVLKVNSQTVVLLSNGSPVEMPWISDVPAVLEGYLGGQAGAGAHAAILFGDINPSGKLAESFPIHLEDTPAFLTFPGGPGTVEYRESLYVGYRFYDSVKKEVLFPFGHGLSYSSFSYNDLQLSTNKTDLKENLTLTCRIKNTGDIFGKEIVQIYVRDKKSTVFRPNMELKGFEKIGLRAGEQQTVSIVLDKRAFSFYDTGSNDWVVETGDFEILIGASSEDIRLRTDVTVLGRKMPDDIPSHTVYTQFPQDAKICREDFEALLGRKIPENVVTKKPYTLNTPIMDMRASIIGRALEKMVRNLIARMFDGDSASPLKLMAERSVLESPLRVLIMFSGGALNHAKLEGLLDLANGKVWKGLKKFLFPDN